MNIGLDYDGTITSDPRAFRAVAANLAGAGHNVYIVTMRYPSEALDAEWNRNLDITGVIYTSRKAKQPFCEALGIKIHVWIDDNPKAIHMDADQAFGGPATPEGVVVTPKYN